MGFPRALKRETRMPIFRFVKYACRPSPRTDFALPYLLRGHHILHTTGRKNYGTVYHFTK